MALVLREVAAGCCTLTLDRPQVHNALDDALIDALTTALDEAGREGSVRYLVLAAKGKSFCAGADLNWMRGLVDADLEQNQQDARRLWTLLEAIAGCSKPVIARVQGAALGGGVGLVAACDLVVASPGAVFGLPEVRLGLAPAMILPFLLGSMRASELRLAALVGERFDAHTARDLGLVSKVSDDLDATVAEWGAALCKAGPTALARTKDLIRGLTRPDWAEASRLTTRAIAELRVGEEGQEGMRAFLARRKPTWRGIR